MSAETGSKLSSQQVAGCFMVIWSLFVTGPIWLILLFLVLHAVGDAIPTWGWVLYWIYVPATILGIISAGIGRLIMDSK